MRYLSDKEAKIARKFIEGGVKVAIKSKCLRARCGSVIVKDGKIIGRGYNSPPRNNSEFRTCLDEYKIPAGFRHDRTCCIHAEQRAIYDAMKRNPKKLKGSRIYFVRVDARGNKESSEEIKCTICSRAVLEAGIAEFILWRRKGVALYDVHEFDRLSYKFKTPKIKRKI